MAAASSPSPRDQGGKKFLLLWEYKQGASTYNQQEGSWRRFLLSHTAALEQGYRKDTLQTPVRIEKLDPVGEVQAVYEVLRGGIIEKKSDHLEEAFRQKNLQTGRERDVRRRFVEIEIRDGDGDHVEKCDEVEREEVDDEFRVVYLLRHGESEANAAGENGHWTIPDPKLTPTGVKQALAWSEYMHLCAAAQNLRQKNLHQQKSLQVQQKQNSVASSSSSATATRNPSSSCESEEFQYKRILVLVSPLRRAIQTAWVAFHKVVWTDSGPVLPCPPPPTRFLLSYVAREQGWEQVANRQIKAISAVSVVQSPSKYDYLREGLPSYSGPNLDLPSVEGEADKPPDRRPSDIFFDRLYLKPGQNKDLPELRGRYWRSDKWDENGYLLKWGDDPQKADFLDGLRETYEAATRQLKDDIFQHLFDTHYEEDGLHHDHDVEVEDRLSNKTRTAPPVQVVAHQQHQLQHQGLHQHVPHQHRHQGAQGLHQGLHQQPNNSANPETQKLRVALQKTAIVVVSHYRTIKALCGLRLGNGQMAKCLFRRRYDQNHDQKTSTASVSPAFELVSVSRLPVPDNETTSTPGKNISTRAGMTPSSGISNSNNNSASTRTFPASRASFGTCFHPSSISEGRSSSFMSASVLLVGKTTAKIPCALLGGGWVRTGFCFSDFGGAVDRGELPRAAAFRELAEELFGVCSMTSSAGSQTHAMKSSHSQLTGDQIVLSFTQQLDRLLAAADLAGEPTVAGPIAVGRKGGHALFLCAAEPVLEAARTAGLVEDTSSLQGKKSCVEMSQRRTQEEMSQQVKKNVETTSTTTRPSSTTAIESLARALRPNNEITAATLVPIRELLSLGGGENGIDVKIEKGGQKLLKDEMPQVRNMEESKLASSSSSSYSPSSRSKVHIPSAASGLKKRQRTNLQNKCSLPDDLGGINIVSNIQQTRSSDYSEFCDDGCVNALYPLWGVEGAHGDVIAYAWRTSVILESLDAALNDNEGVEILVGPWGRPRVQGQSSEHLYAVNPVAMTQTNLRLGTVRRVFRWPRILLRNCFARALQDSGQLLQMLRNAEERMAEL
ncbi:unnamed protein product [Amoebophrya sp. A25]|nr:unnamed protein product [Amoebophrya sp. A25]|eukprot:GSA25T00008986001.1